MVLFFDIYIECDFKVGVFNEQQVQELIDYFIMKICMVCFLCILEFDLLFFGDLIWVMEVIGGMGLDGCMLVIKNFFCYLYILYIMGLVLEFNLIIFWLEELLIVFKKYVVQVLIVIFFLQYENDDLMCIDFNSDDYVIVCCVSLMVIGK